jgi:hypothetical protein
MHDKRDYVDPLWGKGDTKTIKNININNDKLVGVKGLNQCFFSCQGIRCGPGKEVKFNMTFPDAYPFRAPIIQFDKDIKHPNINSDGVLVADFVTPIPDGSWMLFKKVVTVLKELFDLFKTNCPHVVRIIYLKRKKERKKERKTNTIYIYIRRIIKDVEILMMES